MRKRPTIRLVALMLILGTPLFAGTYWGIIGAIHESVDQLKEKNYALTPIPSATPIPIICPITQTIYQNSFPLGYQATDFGRCELNDGGGSSVSGADANTITANSFSLPESLAIRCNGPSKPNGATIFRSFVAPCNIIKMSYQIKLDSIPGVLESWMRGFGCVGYDPSSSQIYTWIGTTKTILASGVTFNGWAQHVIWVKYDESPYKFVVDLGALGIFGPYAVAANYSWQPGYNPTSPSQIVYPSGQSVWDSNWFGWTFPTSPNFGTVYIDDVLVETKPWPF